MLTYHLLKIAPDGGKFASTMLGQLFSMLEVGLALWFILALLLNS